MAVRLKGSVGYQPIVESVSRKFVPRKETCRRSREYGPVTVLSSGWMGGAVRNTSRGVIGASTKNYLVVRANARQSNYSTAELQRQLFFTRVSAATNALMKDLNQISVIQMMWLRAIGDDKDKFINGVSAYGYTFKGWIFAVQYAGGVRNPEYNLSQFPTSFDA